MQRRGAPLVTTAMSLRNEMELTKWLWVPVGFVLDDRCLFFGIPIPG
jgi:hypothetical protein